MVKTDPPVPDPSALKALAHADRLRILGILRFDGPSTATALARRLGLNSGATSYHLRQLARHGFIAQVPDRGNRRERWWQVRQGAAEGDPAALEGAALEEAGLAMIQAVLSQHATLMRQALEAFPTLPPEWRQASNVSDYVMAMTSEQAQALKDRLTAELWDEVRKAPPEASGPGQRRFMVMLHAFPVPGSDEEGEA